MPGLRGAKIPVNVFKPMKGCSIDEIVKVVCDECSTTPEARQIISFIMVKKVRCTLVYVGKVVLGGRDHTTVIHCIRNFENLYETEKGYRDKVERILNRLSV
jgi:chromosomal replication initiation ATPase DnaA